MFGFSWHQTRLRPPATFQIKGTCRPCSHFSIQVMLSLIFLPFKLNSLMSIENFKDFCEESISVKWMHKYQKKFFLFHVLDASTANQLIETMSFTTWYAVFSKFLASILQILCRSSYSLLNEHRLNFCNEYNFIVGLLHSYLTPCIFVAACKA